jgi:hypothetical protein
MLTGLRVSDYKSFSSSLELSIKPLTVMIGKNSSGKTSAARLPLLLYRAVSRSKADLEPMPISARGLDFASDVSEFVYGGQAHGSFSLGASIQSSPGNKHSLDFEVQLVQSLHNQTRSVLSKYSSSATETSISASYNSLGMEYSDKSVTAVYGVLPHFTEPADRTAIFQLQQAFSDEYDSLVHLSAVRQPILSVYELRNGDDAQASDGREAPYLLARDSELLRQVSSWYQAHLGISLAVEANAISFTLYSSDRAGRVKLSRAGQGYQQVLPVVTALCRIIRGDAHIKTLVLEEPELHLHPAVHPAIADLITHSENLILRIRRNIALGYLDASLANILWFDTGAEGARVQSIDVQRDGTVTSWPSGVFQEDLMEVRAIVEAGKAYGNAN